jgi:hypothetical protein
MVQGMTHQAETPGQIIGAFGIGALSGAVSGAISGGVSTGLTVAGLGGFWNGAISGGTAGFASGFIGGAGNAWIGGASFGQGMMEGLKGAGIGFGTGFIIGGITSGVQSIKSGRDFWDGKKLINTKVLFQKNIPKILQDGDYNCAVADIEALSGESQANIRLFTGGDKNSQGLNGDQIQSTIKHFTGRDSYWLKQTSFENLEKLLNYLNNGNDFLLVRGTLEAGLDHGVLLNAVTENTYQKLNGAIITKIIYQVMDPSTASYVRLDVMRINHILNILPK